MPRYDKYDALRSSEYEAVKGGSVNVDWAPDGKSFQYEKGDSRVQYNVATKGLTEPKPYPEPSESAQNEHQRGRLAPGRGRQYSETFSPDGSLRAFYKGYNVHLEKSIGGNQVDVTTIGNEASRTKFGQASWVYGEEFEAHEAMWFSPDGKKLAYYGFDDSKVPDFYVPLGYTQIQDRLEIEAYPKAGVDNPKVSLSIYDVVSKQTTQVDTGYEDPAMGEYVFDVRWSPDGTELLFNRTNRHQNHLQLVAANRETGQCRTVVDENWSKTWNDNHPQIVWLESEKGKFLWLSERNGFRNIYLGDISGKPLKPITKFDSFEVGTVTAVDEKRGAIFFTARDGDNPYKVQFHRVSVDGTGEKRLTDPAFSHTIQLAPDFRHFTDVEQTVTQPPKTQLVDDNGKVLDTLGTADLSGFTRLGLKKSERISFKAADGKTDLFGIVQYPSDFDPAKKYPLVVSVYGGPESGGEAEHFTLPDPHGEFGFICAYFDGRGTTGRGKAFEDAVYKKLGVVEIDDQAAGVKYLATRPYIDGNRVGIYGTSYGGFASLMCLLRHPESFQVAISGSPVTDWRNYDSVYTERYMGLPTIDDNQKGYAEGAAARYADNLSGRLMLYYGTADDNVHPTNMMQLVRALQSSQKSFDMMVGPDEGHSGIDNGRQWEYFIDYLIIHPDK
jgi:dipeptidyl-peptidase-4